MYEQVFFDNKQLACPCCGKLPKDDAIKRLNRATGYFNRSFNIEIGALCEEQFEKGKFTIKERGLLRGEAFKISAKFNLDEKYYFAMCCGRAGFKTIGLYEHSFYIDCGMDTFWEHGSDKDICLTLF